MLSGIKRRLVGVGLLGALVAGAACHAAPRAGPVPLEGSHADLSALAGTWMGRYSSEATGRHGSVTFRLRSGADTAYGEVEMTFSRALRLYGENKADDPALRREPCSVIDIAIVRIEGARVRGTLAPYWDPDCDCRTQTVFEGELAQDHIAGTFTSRRDADPATPVAGHWFADRQRE
jgi:hypothetical protein